MLLYITNFLIKKKTRIKTDLIALAFKSRMKTGKNIDTISFNKFVKNSSYQEGLLGLIWNFRDYFYNFMSKMAEL